jgi:carboxymethylenebutenolidase
MGGRFTYLTAAQHNKDIKAAVAFYGGGIPMGNPSPLSRTGEIKAPMYLFFKKVSFQMKVYPEATHGFFCDERQSYNEAAAKDAWEKTKAFFAQHLK